MPRGGYRPGSGRKCKIDEGIRLECLSSCWELLRDKMNSPDTSEEDKLKIALVLVPRTITQHVESTGTLDVTVEERKFDLNERLKCIERTN